METIRFGRWELSCDPELTRKAYAAIPVGGPEACGCEPCLNFATAREQIYWQPALGLFEKLGISPNREIQIYHLVRLESGLHQYGGWFHIVGSIASGADAAKRVAENMWQPDLEEISENLSIGFSARVALVPAPFKNLPLVQLEFTAEVPWILNAPEPTN
jgi:hypothetical protein